ncbi:MAG: hypothetical protein HPY53_02505 [Brevinematales bacterium]|nr:hypothetical protein [Brevinematales bacterium]
MAKIFKFFGLAILFIFSARLAFSATIVSKNFDGDTTLAGWTRSSTSYVAYYTGTYKIGTGSMKLLYNGSSTLPVSSVGYTGISATFKICGYSLEAGEKIVFEYNTGSGWVIGATLADPADTGAFVAYTVNLPAAANNNSALQIRFRIIANSTADYAYIEDLVISGTSSTPPSGTILSKNFDGDTTLAGWVRSDTVNVTYYTSTYKIGTGSMRIVYNGWASYPISTVGYTGISATFKLLGSSLEAGESIVFEYNTGSGWVIGATLADPSDDLTWKSFSVSIPAAANNNASFQIRFRTIANSTADYGYVEDVVISGTPAIAATPSTHSGMGAIVYTGGVGFRVWAPYATSVTVGGDFNSWSASATPLANEGNGYWSRDVAGATVGQKYKFIVNGTDWKKDPYSKKQESSVGASIIYSQTAPAGIAIPYFEDMIIYQLHVGSYAGSSATGISKFADVANKAQYIKDLGVNMVELLPIMEFPGENSWGYNPTDIFAPESDYGGPEGLKSLVTALHTKGVGIILDIVYNHLGPSDMDLWRFDGWYQNNLGGIYFFNDWRAETPWGHTRPDYGRGEVRQFLRDNAIYWLQTFNVDGLRWDSTINIRKVNYTDEIPEAWTLMQWINNEINAVKGSAISIAEDLAKDPWITYTTGSGGAGFDAQWDAGFVHPVKTAIETGWDSDRNMVDVAAALAIKYGDRCRQVIYVSSHDEVGNGKSRPPSAIDSANPGSWFAKKRSTLGAAVLFTAPGIPMIFQGEEFLQPGWFDNSVYNNFMNWNLVTQNAGIVQMYKDLITLRKNYGALRSNNITVFHVDNANKLIAFHRWNGSQNMVIICNFANKTWNWDYQIGWPVWATGHAVFNSDWNGYSSDFGNFGGWETGPISGGMDGMAQKANIAIAPYSVVVYDLY